MHRISLSTHQNKRPKSQASAVSGLRNRAISLASQMSSSHQVHQVESSSQNRNSEPRNSLPFLSQRRPMSGYRADPVGDPFDRLKQELLSMRASKTPCLIRRGVNNQFVTKLGQLIKCRVVDKLHADVVLPSIGASFIICNAEELQGATSQVFLNWKQKASALQDCSGRSRIILVGNAEMTLAAGLFFNTCVPPCTVSTGAPQILSSPSMTAAAKQVCFEAQLCDRSTQKKSRELISRHLEQASQPESVAPGIVQAIDPMLPQLAAQNGPTFLLELLRGDSNLVGMPPPVAQAIREKLATEVAL